MTLQKREKILAIVTGTALLLWVGLPRVQSVLLGPLQERQARLQSLTEQTGRKTQDVVELKEAVAVLETWQSRSLPPDPYDAQRLYQTWLTDVAQMAGLREMDVVPGRRVRKGDVYTAVLVSLEAQGDFDAIGRFLFYFYRTALAHRLSALSIEPRGQTGAPTFDLTLTAEGLAFSNIEDRDALFPQTVLTTGFDSTATATAAVADASGFPTETEFRIRIGEEYLTVTSVDGNRWQLTGGTDGTQTSRHAEGEEVELAPVPPAYAARTFDDFRALAAETLFVKPSREPIKPTVTPEPKAPEEDAAGNTYFIASIDEDNRHQAWLYNRQRDDQTVLVKGSTISVSDVEGEVLEIGRDFLLLKNAEGTWRLDIGENLRALRRFPRNGE